MEIANEKYLCMKGDFFRIIISGPMNFLQKASDASGKPVYNGTQAIFINGTEGSPGDYFIYKLSDKKLQIVSKKSFSIVVADLFGGCEQALAKAQAGTIASLGEAVTVFNQCGQTAAATIAN
jgi:hypothetical protein